VLVSCYRKTEPNRQPKFGVKNRSKPTGNAKSRTVTTLPNSILAGAPPNSLAGLRGPTSNGRGGDEMGRGQDGRGREGEGGGMGRKEEGREGMRPHCFHAPLIHISGYVPAQTYASHVDFDSFTVLCVNFDAKKSIAKFSA